jgi:uroporphyrinogen decarboxylase
LEIKLNSLERIITVLKKGIPDRVPHFEFSVHRKVIESIIPGADKYDFFEKIGLDAISVRPNMNRNKIEENAWIDERGLIIRKTDQDYFEPVNSIIKNEKDLKKFEFPDPAADHRFNELKEVIKRFKGKIAIISFLRDGWSEARELLGFEKLLINLIDNPVLIKGIIEKSVDYYTELGKLSASLGAEIAFSGDDIAGKNGLFLSPHHFKEIIYPAIKRLYKNWHDSGLYIIKHSDGNLYPIMDLLIETGLDCLHPIDPISGMSLEKVKKDWGDKICIMGNVDCAGNLVFGTEEDVIIEVKNCLNTASSSGGYILASSNSISDDVKPENYKAMVETVKEYGEY